MRRASRRPMSARMTAPPRAPPDPCERGEFSPTATATGRSPTYFIACENSIASSLTSRGRSESKRQAAPNLRQRWPGSSALISTPFDQMSTVIASKISPILKRDTRRPGIRQLKGGRQLVTLEDAGNYITELSKAVHEAADWQAAMEALMLVATLGGPTMFARIEIMRAHSPG